MGTNNTVGNSIPEALVNELQTCSSGADVLNLAQRYNITVPDDVAAALLADNKEEVCDLCGGGCNGVECDECNYLKSKNYCYIYQRTITDLSEAANCPNFSYTDTGY